MPCYRARNGRTRHMHLELVTANLSNRKSHFFFHLIARAGINSGIGRLTGDEEKYAGGI